MSQSELNEKFFKQPSSPDRRCLILRSSLESPTSTVRESPPTLG
ncbi:unnamed protein product [Oikopleura dioica]|uniref:Uncharacterized protein n=1 Tax=Oikopleura dioica TaxID=34765 RepID=E4XN37_OIKDI|nr:unnamed protein product [Oikopleura dioica]